MFQLKTNIYIKVINQAIKMENLRVILFINVNNNIHIVKGGK